MLHFIKKYTKTVILHINISMFVEGFPTNRPTTCAQSPNRAQALFFQSFLTIYPSSTSFLYASFCAISVAKINRSEYSLFSCASPV